MRIDSPCEDDDDDDDDDYLPDKVNALNKPTWWRCFSVFGGVWGTEDINWVTLWKVWCVI